MRLLFFDNMEFLHTRFGPDNGVKHSPIFPEAISVGRKAKGVDPSNDIAAELEYGPVRVYRALLVEHFHGRLQRVDDDEWLTKDIEIDNTTLDH